MFTLIDLSLPGRLYLQYFEQNSYFFYELGIKDNTWDAKRSLQSVIAHKLVVGMSCLSFLYVYLLMIYEIRDITLKRKYDIIFLLFFQVFYIHKTNNDTEELILQ